MVSRAWRHWAKLWPAMLRLARWAGWSRVRLPLACACLAGGAFALGLPIWSGWWTAHVQAEKAREFRLALQQAARPAPAGAASAAPAASAADAFAPLPPPPPPGASSLAPTPPPGSSAAAALGGRVAAVDVPAGDPLAQIQIPAIGVDSTVLEGLTYAPAVWTPLLREGPAHLVGSALPGQPGNVVIFGHLNIWGAVFLRLAELRPGDTVALSTTYGDFTYRVTGSENIDPTDFDALTPARTGPARLQLVTCQGLLDQQRLVVEAALVPQPAGGAA